MLRAPVRIVFFSLSLLLVLGVAEKQAAAQQEKVIIDGKIEYEENCTGCHGLAGKGDGPLADILITRPPDLTGIAKRNGGVFPFWTIYDIIGGEKPVRAHQFSAMPIWGSRFRAEEKTRYAPPTHIRILLLTHYLESLQEK